MRQFGRWKRLILGGFVAGTLGLASTSGELAAAQGLDPGASAGLACPGLVPPGNPPDSSPGWVLQWDWQWQTFNNQSISWPVGIAIDRTCNVYVADGKANQILKLSPTGDVL